jgi:hypothetical protein
MDLITFASTDVLMYMYYKIGAQLEFCILESSQMVITSHPQLCVFVYTYTHTHTHTCTYMHICTPIITHTAFVLWFFKPFCLITPSQFTPLLNLRSPIFVLTPFGWLCSNTLTPYFR